MDTSTSTKTKHNITLTICMRQNVRQLHTGGIICINYFHSIFCLTHWGRVMHICVSKCTIIGSDNGLSPSRHQAIIWTNAGILLIWPLGTNFDKILIKIHAFSFKKIHLKMSGKWHPFCLGSNVLRDITLVKQVSGPDTLNWIIVEMVRLISFWRNITLDIRSIWYYGMPVSVTTAARIHAGSLDFMCSNLILHAYNGHKNMDYWTSNTMTEGPI